VALALVAGGVNLDRVLQQWSRRRIDGVIRIRPSELQRAWRAFLGELGWQDLITLTLDPRLCRSPSENVIHQEAQWWLALLCRLSRRSIDWLCTFERSASGAWHAHALTLGRSTTAEGNRAYETALEAWRVRNGLCDSRRVHHGPGAVEYIVKQEWLTHSAWISDTMLSRAVAAGRRRPALEERHHED
jgi:hypothetical protein